MQSLQGRPYHGQALLSELPPPSFTNPGRTIRKGPYPPKIRSNFFDGVLRFTPSLYDRRASSSKSSALRLVIGEDKMAVYKVSSPKYDEGTEIEAPSAKEAARLWAEQDDAHTGDYSIAGGDAIEVYVQEVEGGPQEHFWITGECIPTYSIQKMS